MVSIQKDVSLKDFSNYKIGGLAKYFFKISNIDELVEGLKEWGGNSKESTVFVLGAGTNLLIDDRGFGGLVIHPKIKFIKKQDSFLRVGAGVLLEDLLNYCSKNSLSGLEWAGGLPGTLGGAIRGNAGAFRGEIKDNIVEVTSLDIKTQKNKKRSNAQCDFRYRSSIFKKGEGENEIIISAKLKLKNGDKNLIREKINEKINYRKSRHPLEYPNIGSIFKNIPVGKVPKKLLEQLKDSIKNDPFPLLPTAKLLAVAGLKGKRVGGAMVSSKHPNFIVNFNNATFEDVKTLIEQIKEIIKEKYAIELEEEITILE